MNFLFVDRIIELNPGKETIGLKHVTADDAYLSANEKNQLALMPCIIGEALGQLCSWNVVKTSDYAFRPVGGVIQEIQIFAAAHPGDTILLESHIDSLDPENKLVNFSGRASVSGKTLLTVTNSLAPLLPLDEFNHLEKVQIDFARLYQPQDYYVETEPTNYDAELETKPFHIEYDKILSWENGKEIVAQKNVSPEALYFTDHFPKKPVFPLSLLMEYNLQLAHTFLKKEHLEKSLRPSIVRKVKINNFVLPGDDVVTRITLKEIKDNRAIVSFRNEVSNKRICIAEAEFELT